MINDQEYITTELKKTLENRINCYRNINLDQNQFI